MTCEIDTERALAATADVERGAWCGEVERVDATTAVVSTHDGLVRARIALSCLVRPEPGDRVKVERCGDVEYVMAVLERDSIAPIVVNVARGVTISVDGELTLEARRLSLRGEAIDIAGERVDVVARALRWVADTLDSSARLVSQVSDRWSTRARSHDRQVEDLELVRVGHLDLRAEHLMQLRAQHTIMQSRELTKIDAKQIQVG